MLEFNKIFFRSFTHINNLYKQYILFLEVNEMKI